MAAIAADFIPWTEAVSLIYKLKEEGNNKMCLIVAFGCFFGIRIGETLSLKWEDVLNKDSFRIEVEKSGRLKKKPRKRKIEIVPDIRKLIAEVYPRCNAKKVSDPIFLNPDTKKVFTTQSINQAIKTIAKSDKYRLSVSQLSTHSFRKTFGRHYWESDDHSERALVELSEIFGHWRIADTRIYLGIRQDEIKAAYHRFKL